jgi:hypothetical protein
MHYARGSESYRFGSGFGSGSTTLVSSISTGSHIHRIHGRYCSVVSVLCVTLVLSVFFILEHYGTPLPPLCLRALPGLFLCLSSLMILSFVGIL